MTIFLGFFAIWPSETPHLFGDVQGPCVHHLLPQLLIVREPGAAEGLSYGSYGTSPFLIGKSTISMVDQL